MILDLKHFFKEISNGGKINFEYLHEQGVYENGVKKNFPIKSKMKFYSKEAMEEFDTYNKKGYGVFFIPNGGGYKDEEINDYRSCFVDMDIKDEIEYELIANGFSGAIDELELEVNNQFKYITETKHKDYKNRFLKRINELRTKGFNTSAIIETKNGYHAYYFLKNGATKELFEQAEILLIHCLNADTACKNSNRLLRVPNTLHLKNQSKPFPVKLIQFEPNNKYDINSIIEILVKLRDSNASQDLYINNKKKGNIHRTKVINQVNGLPKRTVIDYSDNNNGNIALISKGFDGLMQLKEKLNLNNNVDTRYIDREDIRQHLKKQDLVQLLGLGERFYCLFHNSSNPTSGCIYKKDDKYYYKCHSNIRCGVHYDIVELIERLTRMQNWEVFDYLKALYNIAEEKTDWQKKQERLIDINLDVIERFRYDIELFEKYPNLIRFFKTKGTLEMFIEVHNLARRKLPQQAKLREELNNAVIFAPTNKIVEQIVNDKISSINNIDNANTKMVIMIYMYLLNCIGIDYLPEELQRKAKEFKKAGRIVNGKTVHDKYYTRYFEIVSLDTDRLIMAEEMAKYYYDNHLTISSFKREQILKLRGEEEANRIFPDRKGEEIPMFSSLLSKQIESTIIERVNEKGWVTEKEIIDNIHIPNFDKKQAFRNTFKYIKRESSEIDSIVIADDDRGMNKWYTNFIGKKLKENMPIILKNNDLKKVRLNKNIKMILNIHCNINGHIICPSSFEINKDNEQSNSISKIDNKLEMLTFLISNNPKKSNYSLAKEMNCSEGYIRKLKKRLISVE